MHSHSLWYIGFKLGMEIGHQDQPNEIILDGRFSLNNMDLENVDIREGKP